MLAERSRRIARRLIDKERISAVNQSEVISVRHPIHPAAWALIVVVNCERAPSIRSRCIYYLLRCKDSISRLSRKEADLMSRSLNYEIKSHAAKREINGPGCDKNDPGRIKCRLTVSRCFSWCDPVLDHVVTDNTNSSREKR